MWVPNGPAAADGRSATPAGPWDYGGFGCVSRPSPAPSPGIRGAAYSATGRLRTYVVDSAVEGPVDVNVLLPEGYDGSGATRYPVLYLLHGSGETYAAWAASGSVAGVDQGGDVEAILGAYPVITVMPDDSGNGSYADWWGISKANLLGDNLLGILTGAPPATPSWETFDISELVPWVDATFPTRAGAAGRAIAGVSSGGTGAVKYAAEFPGIFGYAGSFSGALDTDLVDATTNWYQDADFLNGVGVPDGHCAFGDPYQDAGPGQRYDWEDNDPTALAANLAGTRLWVASGNGKPGPGDAGLGPVVGGLDATVESVVDDMGHRFVGALRAAGLGGQVTTDFYDDGLHDWNYWQSDLQAFLSWLEPQLGRSVPVPAGYSFRTARVTSSAWGWSFAHRSGLSVRNVNTAEQFVYLTSVGPRGFTAAGNGTLGVTTPSGLFRPHSVHVVRAGAVTLRVTAAASGALAFRVRLGPPARVVQTVFPADGPPSGTPKVTVSIH